MNLKETVEGIRDEDDLRTLYAIKGAVDSRTEAVEFMEITKDETEVRT